MRLRSRLGRHGTMTPAANALCALPHAQGYRAKAQSIRMCWLGATQPTHHDGDGDVQTVATLSWWPAPGPCLGWRRRRAALRRCARGSSAQAAPSRTVATRWDQRRPRHHTVHLVEELALGRSLRRQFQHKVGLPHGSDPRYRFSTRQAHSGVNFADVN